MTNAVVTHREDVTMSQIERVGSKWLVNSHVSEAMITYNCHYTATPVHLLNETIPIQVPVGVILHLEHLALDHLEADRHDVETEMFDASTEHTLWINHS